MPPLSGAGVGGRGWEHIDLPLSVHPSIHLSCRSVVFFCVAGNSKSIIARVMKLYKLIDQHVKLCTCIFSCSSFRRQQSNSPFSAKEWHLWTCVARNSKSLTATAMKLNKPIDQHVNLCTCLLTVDIFLALCIELSPILRPPWFYNHPAFADNCQKTQLFCFIFQ